MASVLRIEIDELKNAIKHLERSNRELQTLLEFDPDPEYRQAIGENIVTMAKKRARVAALEEELRRITGEAPAEEPEAVEPEAVPVEDGPEEHAVQSRPAQQGPGPQAQAEAMDVDAAGGEPAGAAAGTGSEAAAAGAVAAGQGTGQGSGAGTVESGRSAGGGDGVWL
ncbi:hypothetical protein CHLRE_12g535450v5 [Chlamydomonas reinhardtii]|uniref:Uncharacterized protein n=1 Tax=Chlamydomonas reinhardtii TaxID=3055 RepID=A0A2K3D543_CHLRE|nr:uncharacterized protein CHLRE_12g535450v5 [Chlamydomonas reinhardtii]XP_042918736.1 uncharacterized protein CHLRE_12g535450v5 [Chlamydomonas reinhardtii]PNW75652.1 hypothetical protein CHLRE_12g535450v5 [Chlamydomonas reinhardtii]PNW75653.1 hypothetical protein CHLRE_12g535450v5 [Chlamydomonas reinhardtii]